MTSQDYASGSNHLLRGNGDDDTLKMGIIAEVENFSFLLPTATAHSMDTNCKIKSKSIKFIISMYVYIYISCLIIVLIKSLPS